jgi:hypothetical protein
MTLYALLNVPPSPGFIADGVNGLHLALLVEGVTENEGVLGSHTFSSAYDLLNRGTSSLPFIPSF